MRQLNMVFELWAKLIAGGAKAGAPHSFSTSFITHLRALSEAIFVSFLLPCLESTNKPFLLNVRYGLKQMAQRNS
jgi:hypothetical protein